jgi:hypothetical protein
MFWFMKWGTLFGIIMAGAGYFMGNGARDATGNQGIFPMLARYLFDDQGRPQNRHRTTQRGTSAKKQRPKAWESFDSHQEWQYQQETALQDQNVQLSQLMDILSGVAGQVWGGNWWDTASSAVRDEVSESDGSKKSPKSKGQQAGRSR